MKEALFYRKLKDKKVQCSVCAHRCIIASGKQGICGVKENRKGKLYSLVYGKACAENVDPIEKKPLFHFLPGTNSLSIATVGCNFRCFHCQNAEISQMPREKGKIEGFDLPPEKVVEDAQRFGCQSISYTYTEPTIFVEYALDCMKLAKKEGLKNNWVSNGYMTKETLELTASYLDAVNIDLKFFKDDLYIKTSGARLQPVLDSLKLIKKLGIWLEVTTLLIPGYTDQGTQLEEIAKFIKEELGNETPWHVTRFYPAYKMMDVSSTPIKLIDQAYQIGKKEGLKYVYTGNLPGDEHENTYCPECGELVIKRTGYEIERFDKEGKCPKCGEKIDLILE